MNYDCILLGQRFESNDELWEPMICRDKPVLTPDAVKIFGGKPSILGLVEGNDYFSLTGFELRQFFVKNGIVFRPLTRMYVYTIPGVIKILSHGCNSTGVELISAALRLTYRHLSEVSQIQLALSSFRSLYEAEMTLIESRISRLETNAPASVSNDTAIHIDSTPSWTDDEGFIHVNSMNRHVMGYWSMAEVATKLYLYSKDALPHTQLAQDICRAALRISKSAESPGEKYWATFKYSHYDSGKRHDKNCLRLTDEGLNLVTDWWFRNAYKYAFEEKDRHGYHFSLKFGIHPDIPLRRPYKEAVNPVVGNVDDSSIIDAEISEI